MARILLAISNAVYIQGGFKPVCFYEQLINVLTDEGNDVLLYIPNIFHKQVMSGENLLKQDINEDIIVEDIRNFAPELVIAFNNAVYHDILSITDCPIVVWDADFVPLWNQVDLIKENLDRYVFFSHVDYYRRKEQEIIGFKDEQSLVIPQGTIMRNTHAEKKTNISFIGTNFGIPPGWVSFIQNHAGKNDFKIIIKRLKENPFIDKNELLEEISDTKIRNDFSIFSQSDLMYFFSGEARVRTLLMLSELGVDIYAQNEWIKLAPVLPSLAACDTQKIVFTLAENEEVYNQSKICLNINHKTQAAQGMSWRVIDIMATDGCLVSSYSPYIKNKFKSYVDLPMYENDFEAYDLCAKLIKDKVWRSDIVAGSNLAVEKEGCWSHSLKKAGDFLNIKLTGCGKKGTLTILKACYLLKKKSLKNKLRYKIWKHLDKKLKKEGIIP